MRLLRLSCLGVLASALVTGCPPAMNTRRAATGGDGGEGGTSSALSGSGGVPGYGEDGRSGSTQNGSGGVLPGTGGTQSLTTGGNANGGEPSVTGGTGGILANEGGSSGTETSGPTGGSSATGGSGGAGASSATGGSGGAGGSSATGGSGGAGGNSATGGSGATGGSSATGGGGATGGSSGSAGEGGAEGGAGASAGGSEGGAAGAGDSCNIPAGNRLMEDLGRGLVAVSTGSGVYVGWRILGTDPANMSFHVYRGSTRLTSDPIQDSSNYLDPDGHAASTYTVRPVIDGVEQEPTPETTPLTQSYLSIPLDQGTTQGVNLVGVGDLDGDGEFDLVVKRASQDIDPGSSAWVPSTDTFKLEAYRTDGQFLWRVDLGPNIEQGVWYSPFTVFDLDGDGRAEVITKWAERLGEDLNQDGVTDYRNATGRVLAGPEYLAVLDGETGAIRARVNWIPRGYVGDWGDTYGNRVSRNLIGIAYLDGQRPSVVMFRGTYDLMVAEAWNFRAGSLSRVWRWIRGQGGGYHGIRVGDIDQDGKDEIINGSIAMDHSGGTLWVHGEGHGDRLQMTDIDPARPGLEIFFVQEDPSWYVHAHHLRDARNGALLWGPVGNLGDNGRGNCADLVPSLVGVECWSAADPSLYDATGLIVSSGKPASTNFSIWWDDDLLRELMDSTHIDKYAGPSLMSADGCTPGQRLAPMGYADILGDWREEVIHLCGDSLRVYTTTTLTNVRQYTFMHDSDYRTSVAAETMGYMQSTQPSFYFGAGMAPAPEPKISVTCRAETMAAGGAEGQ